MVAVPLVLSENLTALGSGPDLLMNGTGEPVAVTAKEELAPTVAVVVAALVMVVVAA